ncbi:MAG TPA: class I SAM-dependent methyltransferase [Acidimicrobiales bacterium]|nr:class I SAM-dependent methyltransferase [Acidimicrobiales bacterium]
MCKSTVLVRYLDLGLQPPADQFHPTDTAGLRPVTYYPLSVVLCEQCGLSQLGYVVEPEILYQDEYPYEASTTSAGRAHFADFAQTVAHDFGLGSTDLAVDVGSNVGVLLAGFRAAGVRIRGVDPATNIARIAEERGIPTIAQFFSPEVADRIVHEDGRASVVTATNVFAHVDDLDTFMVAIDRLLTADGIFVVEAPYFLNLLRDLEYDTIYHEHLSYLSLTPMATFFGARGFEIFDVRQVDIHGGSMRVFVGRHGQREVDPVVRNLIAAEEDDGIHDLDRLQRFARDVEANREAMRELVYGLHRDGSRLAIVSAPAKGMTLLNYCGFGRDVFEFATEKSLLKIGRCTPGGQIPVVADFELTRRRPDLALLLAWNFADEIMHNLTDYSQAGGKFIVPIPEPRIVS